MSSYELFSLIAIGFLLICSAFFSGSETSLTAVSRSRIYHLVTQGNKRARTVQKLREEKESLIGAILLGNNLVNIFSSALATSLAISLWGDAGVVYATAAMTVLVLLFGEVMPKTIALQRSEYIALAVAPFVNVIVKVFYPATAAVKLIIRSIFALFRVKLDDEHSFISVTDVLRGTIEMHHREGAMQKHDRDMLGGVLELEDIEVEEIMVHRKQIDAINLDDSVQDIINHATSSNHSRLPIYQGDFNHILGILHVKNLLRLINRKGWGEVTHQDILRVVSKPWFIPSTTSLKDQLYAFRQKRQHFAMVVDEYGSLLGIVTLEDVIEEIVGEIDDEYDTIDMTDIIQLQPDIWLVDGDVGIRDLNRYLDWNLSDEEATTLAGLVLHHARDIPQVGEAFVIQDVRFTVEARTETQITRLKVENLAPATAEDAGDAV